MAGQLTPGGYTTRGGWPAKVARIGLAQGEWWLVGAINLADNVWTLTFWTLTGMSKTDSRFDLGSYEKKEK